MFTTVNVFRCYPYMVGYNTNKVILKSYGSNDVLANKKFHVSISSALFLRQRTIIPLQSTIRGYQPSPRPKPSNVTTTEVDTTSRPPKPYKSIPRAGLPVIGTLPYIIKHGFRNLHLHQIEMEKKYGLLYRGEIGHVKTLNISDPRIIEEMIRQEDRNPIRMSVEPWKVYREQRGVDYGLVTLDHEPWRKARFFLSKRMLRPNEIVQYMEKLNNTADEFIQRLKRQMQSNVEEGIVPDLNNEFYKWAMESVAIILFDVQLGCIKDRMPTEAQEFINAINKMFTSLSPLVMIPLRIHTTLNTKSWRTHVQSWDTIWNTAMKYINLKCKSINENGMKLVDEENVDLLTYLLASKKLSMSEICGNIVEFLLGGVDTTSNTLLWALYRLSKAPDCQQRLHAELTTVLNGAPLDKHNIQNIPYLKCVIKETLRLYPPVPNNSRIPQMDITLGGYNIPKGTNILISGYSMARSNDNFEDANEFKPERWLRDNSRSKVDAFASLPFGFGTRMCIGKRIAEMENWILLSKICQTFIMKPADDTELVGSLRGLLIPEKDIPIRFELRGT